MTWGAAEPGSLGVEEEILLVDEATYEVVPGFSRIVEVPTAEVKPELFECFVELATPVVVDAAHALDELQRLRA